MDPKLLQILLDADDSTGCESPPGFCWDRECERVGKLKPRLEAVLRFALELDCSAQDASFFADLVRYEEFAPRSFRAIFGIRFSSFGSLCTDLRHPDSIAAPVADEGMAQVKALLSEAGFKYVEPEELQEIYFGKNETLAGHISWWIRYFDYL
jgi:hypothetical protein